MARPSGLSRHKTPSASCGSVNEVSARGRAKRTDPVTTARPTRRRPSRGVIPQRRPRSPIQASWMGSGPLLERPS